MSSSVPRRAHTVVAGAYEHFPPRNAVEADPGSLPTTGKVRPGNPANDATPDSTVRLERDRNRPGGPIDDRRTGWLTPARTRDLPAFDGYRHACARPRTRSEAGEARLFTSFRGTIVPHGSGMELHEHLLAAMGI